MVPSNYANCRNFRDSITTQRSDASLVGRRLSGQKRNCRDSITTRRSDAGLSRAPAMERAEKREYGAEGGDEAIVARADSTGWQIFESSRYGRRRTRLL